MLFCHRVGCVFNFWMNISNKEIPCNFLPYDKFFNYSCMCQSNLTTTPKEAAFFFN